MLRPWLSHIYPSALSPDLYRLLFELYRLLIKLYRLLFELYWLLLDWWRLLCRLHLPASLHSCDVSVVATMEGHTVLSTLSSSVQTSFPPLPDPEPALAHPSVLLHSEAASPVYPGAAPRTPAAERGAASQRPLPGPELEAVVVVVGCCRRMAG